MNIFRYNVLYYSAVIRRFIINFELRIQLLICQCKLLLQGCKIFFSNKSYRRIIYLTVKSKYMDWKINNSLKKESRITGLSIELLKQIHNIK